MKMIKLALLASLTATAFCSPANADDHSLDDHYYIGSLLGANWVNMHRGDKWILPSFKTGLIGGLAVGYRFSPQYRAEIEGTYRNNKLNHVRYYNREYKVDIKLYTVSIMSNFYFDLAKLNKFYGLQPYLGFGIGYAYSEFGTKSVKSNGYGFASQYMMGLTERLTENTTGALEFRYFDGRKNNNDFSLLFTIKSYI